MRFKLEIDVNTTAVNTTGVLADLLRSVAKQLNIRHGEGGAIASNIGQTVRDANGVAVGGYAVIDGNYLSNDTPTYPHGVRAICRPDCDPGE